MHADLPWWATTTIYQIYPRSFMDSNGDGIGDLKGILSKLDYIQDLGFETLWISPFFSSPQQDFGYDVSDYTAVAPEFGSLEDALDLIQAVHARGMRVLFDLVLNHTSIQHPWFQESRSSRNNPRRDWYIWRQGRKGRPPNNWVSIPGGSGWHFDPPSGEYYFASFLPFQPDLNWRNPQVKGAMFAVIRFWLDHGVDGFRLDIFHSIFKDAHFRDNPFSFHYLPKDDRVGFFQQWKYTLNRPEVFELAWELRALLETYLPQRMLVGEVFGSDQNVKRFLGDRRDGLNLIFLWELLDLKAKAGFLRDVVRHYQQHYPPPFIPVYVFGNHDRRRVLSRLGEDPQMAKLLAFFQLTVRGVPVTYYGEEIGMLEEEIPDHLSLDPIGQRYKHIPAWVKDLLNLYTNRDGCRTPMQWQAGPNAGFCPDSVTPWLPLHPNYRATNVQAQAQDRASVLNTYKSLLKRRREHPALQSGTLQLLEGPHIPKDLLVYQREAQGETILVAINFGKTPAAFPNPTASCRVLLSVGAGSPVVDASIHLPPLSAVLLADG